MIPALTVPLLAIAQVVTFQNSPGGVDPQPAIGTATISGTVVNDVTNEPVRKARVSLLGPAGGQQPMAVTDASGAFAFHKLPAGTFTVQAAKDGFDQERGLILGDNQKQITVVTDQNVAGVGLRLAPTGAISGRLIDEIGDPAPYCQVSAISADPPRQQRGSANSDDRGEYRISNLPAGRYLIYQQCHQTLAAPHPFMERGDPRTPVWAWIPGFYGGAEAGAGASALSLHEGEEVRGIDFRLKTTNAYAVEIAVVPDDQSVDLRRVSTRLVPRDPTLAGVAQYGIGRPNSGGPFRATGVIPGSYIAIADYQDNEKRWHGEAPVDVGDAPPDLVRLALLGAMTVIGDADFGKSDESSVNEQNPMRGTVTLVPVDPSGGAPWGQGQIAADGTFTVGGMIPGRYRLQVNGGSMSIRSATLGGHDVSPLGFDIVQGAPGPLHLVISTKQVQVQVSVSGVDQNSTGWLVLLPKGATAGAMPMNPSMAPIQNSSVPISVPPGEYTAYALECQQPWPVLNNAAILHDIADLGKQVEVKDGSNTAVSVDLIGRDALKQALDKDMR